jgi:hypothetical protein
VHGEIAFVARLVGLFPLKGSMPRPKVHYTLMLKNHRAGERLKLDLVDLPFLNAKSFRLRINNRWAKKMPVASKTAVMRQLRQWWVAH